jgi:bifunctional DNase/RNase
VKKVKLEILGLTASRSQSGSFALVLGEYEGNRRIPIVIGMFEAQAIAVELEKIVSSRPMTHDLFKTLTKNFDIIVEEVLISDLQEGIFFAKIICSSLHRSDVVEIDARPSDAIAIGIRHNAPIYALEKIVAEAGIVLSDIDEPTPQEPKSKEKQGLKDYSTTELEEMMNKAILNEEYEKAAIIRDELEKRK